MTLQSPDLMHLFVAVTVLLVVAHTAGHLFLLLRQPPVIGEIVGGLLLGPTVLGVFAPDAQRWLFPSTGPAAAGLGVLYEAGLLLLLFLSGREMVEHRSGGRGKSTAAMAVIGVVVPFAAGLFTARFLDIAELSGPQGTRTSVGLVFGIGVAVTSIPVISRIMLDLDILRTGFARVVLSIAVFEDLVLYVMLSVVLGLAQAKSGSAYGLWSLFDNNDAVPSTIYYVVASLVFFAVFLPLGRWFFRMLAIGPASFIEKRSPTGFRLVFMLGMALACVGLGINPVFGALLAGAAAAGADIRVTEPERRASADAAWEALKRFSLAFFIPLYFANVGVQLDLAHHFPLLFFCAFLTMACLVKLVSVWAAARLAGEDNRSARHFAVALNARGGPGIVLATVTLAAGVINEDFYTVLAMLSIVTSQIAGVWLHVFRKQVVNMAQQTAAPPAMAEPGGAAPSAKQR
ncbi:cation:proton antiporter [Streptomyces iranensis]|uniref:Kef-type K+ transport system membrane component KefB n=1 Tax=Streptomyces iranensis TaxID=576784 RepID=A0A061ACP7_9ACTN|nr:cation:proton antiporter [Streptomyces iranensis]MBP2067668.1 Kef-type K+ transport system membrane component KefB [Streptomyces iranensis]CDR18226.1 sodium/hydrogen exchanger [Streptomyces iranensis]